MDAPLYETVKRLHTTIDFNSSMSSRNSTPDVITITTDQGLSKQLHNQSSASSSSLQNSLQSASSQALAAAAASSKKRKRHIAIDVETERAKLHALLNNTQSPGKYLVTEKNAYLVSSFWLELVQIGLLVFFFFLLKNPLFALLCRIDSDLFKR